MVDMGRVESARLARALGVPTVGMIAEGSKLTDGWPDVDAVFRRERVGSTEGYLWIS